mmetsp:Transcript_23220/g.37324  ORF Transcript_23220/g.37324 Transcript_23220/m.37324 type:complete len:234 (+) Transcript_23220:766-1467(+)
MASCWPVGKEEPEVEERVEVHTSRWNLGLTHGPHGDSRPPVRRGRVVALVTQTLWQQHGRVKQIDHGEGQKRLPRMFLMVTVEAKKSSTSKRRGNEANVHAQQHTGVLRGQLVRLASRHQVCRIRKWHREGTACQASQDSSHQAAVDTQAAGISQNTEWQDIQHSCGNGVYLQRLPSPAVRQGSQDRGHQLREDSAKADRESPVEGPIRRMLHTQQLLHKRHGPNEDEPKEQV